MMADLSSSFLSETSAKSCVPGVVLLELSDSMKIYVVLETSFGLSYDIILSQSDTYTISLHNTWRFRLLLCSVVAIWSQFSPKTNDSILKPKANDPQSAPFIRSPK